MKNFLKKLHIVPSQPSDDVDGPPTPPKKASTGGGGGGGAVQHELNKLSNWLNSVASKHGSSASSPPLVGDRSEGSSSEAVVMETARRESGSGSVSGRATPAPPPPPEEPAAEGAAPRAVEEEDLEEYQIQLALELSAREDPEAVQIEVAKQISLGSCPVESTPAEVVAYRYWNYNALSYDDKILDGFYDFYGIWDVPSLFKMPSLTDLQSKPFEESASWEAVLVNRSEDGDLVKLEQKALVMSSELRSKGSDFVGGILVQRLASLVASYMGGVVYDPESMFINNKNLSNYLRVSLRNMVLPLGRITSGLARHRALLFKVLADSLGIPCRLVRGKEYTGSHDGALNIVKFDDGREFIVDLMSGPGTLVPSDGAGLAREYEQDSFFPPNHFNRDTYSTASTAGASSSAGCSSFDTSGIPTTSNSSHHDTPKSFTSETEATSKAEQKSPATAVNQTPPAVRRTKMQDVSQYMINAAKENPKLAQKLHDVLLESGVNAPPDLFSELTTEEQEFETKYENMDEMKTRTNEKNTHGPYLPQLGPAKPTETAGSSSRSQMPVTAAAVATAAMVASSMVVAAAKSNSEISFKVPVAAAAATVTAAAVVASTAAVSKQEEGREEEGENEPDKSVSGVITQEAKRSSDKSTGTESIKSDMALDDVAEFEILWEDIILGERIGLGSFGEVYKGDWHGTEVAVKKFLHQDISSDALEEFRSEVRIMKRLRHPNVVLFMGAITRVPNLSIVTEFLPRGSLFRLIHRPNNQLDERRRLRMALDVARGMNYLHNCSPIIVHRDLKSPNLLVDKNWVVKVCDFGLSRIKKNTFLSSRSTAGTAEWMAPEVLRNEPSDEKCDVFSFGVILWELCTLQQPWEGMNPMQVVGAVGFQHRRLDIPDNMGPLISSIITSCWQTDPKKRPSFSEIMAVLKPMLKTLPHAQAPRPRDVPQKDDS